MAWGGRKRGFWGKSGDVNHTESEARRHYPRRLQSERRNVQPSPPRHRKPHQAKRNLPKHSGCFVPSHPVLKSQAGSSRDSNAASKVVLLTLDRNLRRKARARQLTAANEADMVLIFATDTRVVVSERDIYFATLFLARGMGCLVVYLGIRDRLQYDDMCEQWLAVTGPGPLSVSPSRQLPLRRFPHHQFLSMSIPTSSIPPTLDWYYF